MRDPRPLLLLFTLLLPPAQAAVSPSVVHLDSGGCDPSAPPADDSGRRTVHATVSGAVDVVFLFDLTQDFKPIVNLWREHASEAIHGLRAALPGRDMQLAVAALWDHFGRFDSCGYDGIYYKVDHPAFQVCAPIGSTHEEVIVAIQGLQAEVSRAGGGDLAEGYALGFWEVAQPDSGLKLRAHAETILVAFTNSVPHDCDLTQGIVQGDRCHVYKASTGQDPGRDGVLGTADDLDWHDDTLPALRDAGVELIVLYSGALIERCLWDSWTAIVGGETEQFGSFGQLEDPDAFMTDRAIELIAKYAPAAVDDPTAVELHLEEDCAFGLEVERGGGESEGLAHFQETFVLPSPLPEAPGRVACKVEVVLGGKVIDTQTVEWSHGDVVPPVIDLELQSVENGQSPATIASSPTRFRRRVSFDARDECPGPVRVTATIQGRRVEPGQLVQLRRPGDEDPELESVLYFDVPRLELVVQAVDAAGNRAERMVGFTRPIPQKR